MRPSRTRTALPYRLVAGLAFGAVVLVAVPVMLRLAWAPANNMPLVSETPPRSSAIASHAPDMAYSAEQKSTITNVTANLGPLSTGFTEDLRSKLLAKMPQKKKIVVLNTIGGPADQRTGKEIQDFLQQNGYEVQRFRSNVSIPSPERPFTLLDSPDSYILTVAPGAR